MSETPRDLLDDLFQRLRALAAHDRGLRVFGASQHRYQVCSLRPQDLEAARVRHGVQSLPADWAWWVSQGPGVGAGPFYGLRHPGDVEPATDALAGALPLSDHGCGYADWLLTAGPDAGRVIVDLREGGGPIQVIYDSFGAWLDAWLWRSAAEWGIETLEVGVPEELDAGFLSAVREALERLVAGTEDPLLGLYPLPLDKAHGALGSLHLAAGDLAAAARAFDAAAATSREPEAWAALGRCRLAVARGAPEERLTAAEEGLRAPQLWWITKGRLLTHRAAALEELSRWDEAVQAREEVADHHPADVQKNLDLVWIRMLRRETHLAAARVRALAERGVGCDPAAALPERLQQVVGGLLQALRDQQLADRADALQAALGET